MNRLLIPTMAVCLAAAAPGLAEGSKRLSPAGFPDPAQYEIGSRQWLKASEALKYRPLVHSMLTDNCPHSFDVLHYNVEMYIDFDNEALYGDTRITSVSQQADLSSINLDLTVLAVDSVLGWGGQLNYTHNDPVLTIDLGNSYAAGDTFEVRVVYHGQPGNEGPSGFGGFYFDGAPLMAFQMGVGLVADPPSMGKYWIPCWDWPCDKATAEYHVTVPGTGKKVVCNGVLVETVIDSVASTAKYVWSETHQIAPHLMMVAARRYTELVDSTYDWIHYWVYPTDVADALIHFQNVDIMMDAFVARYGVFPFSKFGYAMATKGDMEHQTCITHSAATVQANHLYDWLLAHEMGHQWWGDCVSVNDWRDVWLSEGFATYSEAVFMEYAYGAQAYRDYMQQYLMNPVFNSGENFPIYDPVNLWGTTTYEKGGCVLHMLRHVIGDSTFFAALAAYRQAYEYQSATTAQFQQVVESVGGEDLDWFFNEWIYDVGWPEYEYSWMASDIGASYNLNLVIDQVQTNGPVFEMPVDVKVATAAGDTVVSVRVADAHEVFDITIDAQPTGVALDPYNWILNRATEVPHAGIGAADGRYDLRLEHSAPNPFAPATTIRYWLPRDQRVRVDVYDATGRRVANLVDGAAGAGWNAVTWQGKNDVGQAVAAGNYLCRLVAADGTRATRLIVLR